MKGSFKKMCITDPGGGEVLEEHVNVVKTPTPPAQHVIDRQEVDSSRASGSALEQRRSIPIPSTSQISTLPESSSTSKMSQRMVSQSASRPC